jgi:hypothetical protein
LACRNGSAAASSSAVTPPAASHGRACTRRASRPKNPSSVIGRRAGLSLVPHIASSAGIRVSAAASATSTVAIPPTATEVNVGSPNANRPASAAATVSAEKVMVRPAVASVRATAAVMPCPAARASRNRLTISRL